eukprot:TRINITY_DN76066_c0_g1_i1.p1 TRINITY_DN76066_c0_g1~~TRINITY_DN76066_c0_g1_i1.p1  ORF type:complete len:504 (-),score=144.94 TRINITY_DN76066_c0_g1_i1:173-1684(-)
MASFGWVNDLFGGGETAVQQPISPPATGAGYGNFGGLFSPWGAPQQAPQAPGVPGGKEDARPTQTEANLLAKAVRVKGEKKLVKAWEDLMGEFDVQNRIWDSLTTAAEGDPAAGAAKAAAAAAGPEGARARMKVSMNKALDASQEDPKGAVQLLKPLISVSTPGHEAPAKILNHSTEKAAHLVVKALRLTQLCERLSQSLEAMGAGSEEKELESLLVACQLQEGPLESKARRVLGLGLSKADKAKVARQAKESEQAALKATIMQIASAGNVSQEKAAAVLEAAKGDADQALTMILSEEEERQARKAAALADKMEKRMEQKQKIWEAKVKEARSLATIVGKLAGSTVRNAWAKVGSEFEVQMNVWDSVAAANGNGGAQYQAIQMEMQSVLDQASSDPANSVMLLEYVLQRITMETRLQLSNGLMLAADGVLDAERVAGYRRQLTSRLLQLSKSADNEYNAGVEAELKSLAMSCNLEEVLKRRVLDLVKPKSIVKSGVTPVVVSM